MTIETHLAHARRMKEGLVARHGIGADIQPQLVLLERQRTTAVLVMPEAGRDRQLANIALAVALTDADEVVYFIEGFGDAGRDVLERYEYGSFQRRFAAGDPDVSECVIVTLATAVSHIAAQQAYTYNGRTVEWKKPVTFGVGDTAVTGALADVLRAGFRARAEREGPAMSVAELSGALGVIAMGER